MEGETSATASGDSIPKGFKAYDEGTYGKIMYHDESGVILKRMKLVQPPPPPAPAPASSADAADEAEEDGAEEATDDAGDDADDAPTEGAEFLEYATVSELGFYGSMLVRPPIAGILPLIRYERTDSAVDLYFPNGGTTLYKWLRKQTTRRRREVAPEILYQLVSTLAELYDRGIQNTDTKPANILIRETGASGGGRLEVHLIDYNLISFRVRFLNGKYGWTESFGTWCYCAPELLENNAPSDTSLVWTLGVLLSTILIHFPYEGYSALKSAEMNSRRFWLKNFKRLAAEYPAHLPLPPGYSLSFTPYTHDLYRRCTQWDPTKRPTLAELRDELAAMLRPAPVAAPSLVRRDAADPLWRPLKPRRCRQAAAADFYAVFEQNRWSFPPHIFAAAVLYLDRGSSAAAPYADAAFHLAMLFYHQYNYDIPGLSLRHPLFADGAAVWELGDALGWNLTIPTDLLYVAAYNPDIFYYTFRDIQKPYSDRDIYLKLTRPRKPANESDSEAEAEAESESSSDTSDDDADADAADAAIDVSNVSTTETDRPVSSDSE